jgi:hypothetical protein
MISSSYRTVAFSSDLSSLPGDGVGGCSVSTFGLGPMPALVSLPALMVPFVTIVALFVAFYTAADAFSAF